MALNKTCCCIIWAVPESKRGIVTRLGAFKKILPPGGPYCIDPLFESVSALADMRQRQISLIIRTKTKDDTELKIDIQVQFKILDTPEGISNSVFKLSNYQQQMQAFVEDVVRSSISKQNMNDVYESKDVLAKDIREALQDSMSQYGYEIVHALVTNVEPGVEVQRAMNSKAKAQYTLEATKYSATMDFEARVVEGEAQKIAQKLLGEGVSKQRQAIVDGLSKSVESFSTKVSDVSPKDILEIVLMTQYFDMMKEVGDKNKNGQVVFTPGTQTQADQMRDAFLQSKHG